MVFGRLVKKIKEERMARKAEKKLKQIEERRKIELEKNWLMSKGLDEDEAEALAKKRVEKRRRIIEGKREKDRKKVKRVKRRMRRAFDILSNIVDAYEGGDSTRSRKSSKSKKSSKRTRREKSVFDDLNDYFNELDRAFGKGGLL